MRAPRKEVLSVGIEICLGDCRDVLPLIGSVDITVTSPTYNTLPLSSKGTGLHAERKVWLTKAAVGYSDNMPEEEYQEWVKRHN